MFQRKQRFLVHSFVPAWHETCTILTQLFVCININSNRKLYCIWKWMVLLTGTVPQGAISEPGSSHTDVTSTTVNTGWNHVMKWYSDMLYCTVVTSSTHWVAADCGPPPAWFGWRLCPFHSCLVVVSEPTLQTEPHVYCIADTGHVFITVHHYFQDTGSIRPCIAGYTCTMQWHHCHLWMVAQ